MTRDEIYDHLAQVYLGKCNGAYEKKKARHSFNKKLFGQILGVVIILVCIFGLTAFISAKQSNSDSNIILALSNSPLRVPYNLLAPYPQVKSFSITLPKMDISKYEHLNFSIRGTEEGYPGVVKILIKNEKNEVATRYVQGVKLRWQRIDIPLSNFEPITDWENITDVSFVLEAWNTEKKKGSILIDDLSFSSFGKSS